MLQNNNEKVDSMRDLIYRDELMCQLLRAHLKLRDELYETDAITMRGLALLNRFIEKYSKGEIDDE